MQRVPGLVQERLVVVQAALRARDQVDDLRRIRRDHARARRLLRPVVEVEPDVLVVLHVEAELAAASSMQTSTPRSFVYVDSSGDSRRMYALWNDAGTSSRSGPSSRSNQRSRSRAHALVDRGARRRERALELAQRDLLLLLVARDVVRRRR